MKTRRGVTERGEDSSVEALKESYQIRRLMRRIRRTKRRMASVARLAVSFFFTLCARAGHALTVSRDFRPWSLRVSHHSCESVVKLA